MLDTSLGLNLVHCIAQLNQAARKANMVYVIRKHPNEDNYQIEVSSPNFDGRKSLNFEPEFIDDAFDKMIEFCRCE